MDVISIVVGMSNAVGMPTVCRVMCTDGPSPESSTGFDPKLSEVTEELR